MAAPSLSTIITNLATGLNDRIQGAFNKANANFAALLSYASGIESRVANLERYSFAPSGTAITPATDNSAFTYSQKTTPWTTDTKLSSLLFSTTTTMSIQQVVTLQSDANGVPTVILFMCWDSSAAKFTAFTISHVPSTGALALVASLAMPSTVNASTVTCVAMIATTTTAARAVFSMLSGTIGDYAVDITTDASGASLATAITSNLYIRATAGLPASATRTMKGYLCGTSSFLFPLWSPFPSGGGYRSEMGLVKMGRATGNGDHNLHELSPGQDTTTTAFSMNQDVLGASRYVTIVPAWQTGYGWRPCAQVITADDASVLIRGQAWLPYALTTIYGCYAISGSLALVQFSDGSYTRTCAMSVDASYNVTQVAAGEDHTNLYANSAWKGALTYSTSTLAILLQTSTGIACTWNYAKCDITNAATPMSQGTSIGAAIAASIGSSTGGTTYGTTTTVSGVLRLGQGSTTDNYLAWGSATGSGGGAFCEVHQLS